MEGGRKQSSAILFSPGLPTFGTELCFRYQINRVSKCNREDTLTVRIVPYAVCEVAMSCGPFSLNFNMWLRPVGRWEGTKGPLNVIDGFAWLQLSDRNNRKGTHSYALEETAFIYASLCTLESKRSSRWISIFCGSCNQFYKMPMTCVELVAAVRRFLPWPFSGTKIVCLEPSIEEQHELKMQLHQLSCDIKDDYLILDDDTWWHCQTCFFHLVTWSTPSWHSVENCLKNQNERWHTKNWEVAYQE